MLPDLLNELLFLGWAVCMSAASVLIIYIGCKTTVKKTAAKIAARCLDNKPKWGENDELDELMDHRTHKKALAALEQSFVQRTNELDSKINKISPKIVIQHNCPSKNVIASVPPSSIVIKMGKFKQGKVIKNEHGSNNEDVQDTWSTYRK